MKKNYLARTAVSVLCACSMVFTVISPIAVFASSTDTVISQTQESLPAPPSYDSVYRISSQHIKSITNNAGNYGQSVISKAIDGNPATHWETNRPNNASFNNIVTVTLDAPYEISTVQYQARQDAGAKGFATQYNLYYSATESGEDFTLLKSGNLGNATTSVVDIDFAPTNIRRIKFEYVKANADWASMAEIAFYKYDALTEQMDNIFTDGTCSKLKDEYNDQAMLDRMKEEAMAHPSRDSFLPLLKDTQILFETPNAFDERIVTGSQRGNVAKEKSRTKINYGMFAFDSTGYYVSPGETIYVYVDADENGVMPQLVFGQIANDKGGWHRKINLKRGMNKITAQTMDRMNPAAIYISNEALPSDQAYAPRVRISGGTKFPLYVHGETDTQTFRAELEEYLKNVSYKDSDFANGNPNGYYYNIAEITSENTTITTSAAGAFNEVNTIIKSGSSVEKKMDEWENMYFEYARYSGYEMEDESSPNYRPRGKFMSRVFSSCPYGFADYGYTGYLGGEPERRASGFYASLISAASNGGWALYHEWGHVYDNNAIGRGESTNNLYSLIMQDIYLTNNRMVQENRWENHFTKYHNTKIYPNDQLFYGAIVYQLQAVYGKDLYGKAQAIIRMDSSGRFNGLSNNDRLATSLSMAAGIDLTSHFDYYGETVTAKAKALVADLPAVDKKTYYVNNKSFTKDATAFKDENAKPEVQAAANNGAVLTISMDEPNNAILCYDIYRNGKFVGVTYSSTFTDKTFEENMEHTYTAIAYDRKLNPSQMSDAVTINPSAPIIAASDSVLVSLNQSFDPLAYVAAKDIKGNDITSQIEVMENNVDTTKRGEYSVTYRVADAAGNVNVAVMPITVVSVFTYLSDLQQVSATVGWGSLAKDKSVTNKPISLTNGISEKVFAKGLGVHAKSEVVYDVDGKNYAYFDSFIGVDSAMRTSTASSVNFEVWVDGSRVYNSGLMNSKTPMKHVMVDVKDAKTVKLVVTDCENGNSSDHADWADAKFATVDAKPVIEALDYSFEPGDEFSVEELAKRATAYDVEDGDITGQLKYTTNYIPGQSGNFSINYTVTDSDGNSVESVSKLAVVNSFVYVSDTNWKTATSGWKSVSKDIAVCGKPISLLTSDGVQVYQKGIGTHATSEITYDLTGKDYYYFTSYVGIDRLGGNSLSSVIFKVYLDGKLVKETSLMKYGTQQEFIKVNLAGAKQLKLVATDGGNGNGNDHANWADAKFLTAVTKSDKAKLYKAVQDADKVTNNNYTVQTWNDFVEAKADAKNVLADLNAEQSVVDTAVIKLKSAIDGLKPLVVKTNLEAILAFADAMIDETYVDQKLAHAQTRWINFVAVRDAVNRLYNNDDTTQMQIDECIRPMIYYINETGQKYTVGTLPIQFVKVDKSLLNAVIDSAKAVDVSIYTPQSVLAFNSAKQDSIAIFNNILSNQEQVDLAAQKLQAAMNSLQLLTDKSKLQALLAFADQMSSVQYIKPTLSFVQTRWDNFTMIRDLAHSTQSNIHTTQKEIDSVVAFLQYCIEETGQAYVVGGAPRAF